MHTALPDAGKTVYMAGYSAVKVQFQAVLPCILFTNTLTTNLP